MKSPIESASLLPPFSEFFGSTPALSLLYFNTLIIFYSFFGCGSEDEGVKFLIANTFDV